MEHISNEEKARVLSIKGSLGVYIRTDIGILVAEETKKSLYGACLEAMEWKDKQHTKEKQKLIDEACKWLEVNDSYAIPTNLQVYRLREHLNNKMKGE